MTAPASPDPLPLDKAPERISGMFDAIAARYDLLNTVLSAGFDRRWRRRAVEALALGDGARVLDLCTGTADLALALAGQGAERYVLGVDFAGAMLQHGLAKVRQQGLAHGIGLSRGDAMAIPCGDDRFDAATIAFGIRNVSDAGVALREVHRVLRPGGRLAILEFGHPTWKPLRAVYLWYFQTVLPRIGRLVSRHDSAYRYLPASVGSFPAPEVFRASLETAGFAAVTATPLTGGVVFLYQGVKPAAVPDRPTAAGRL